MTQTPKKIPYGIADAAEVLSNKYYYVDKTHFIPVLENAGRHIVVLRPRRFGKSLLISTLELYYDINRKHRFQEFFKNTWIGKNPTELQGSFLVIRFNFSAVRADPLKVEHDFNLYVHDILVRFVDRYKKLIPDDLKKSILALENGVEMLRRVLSEEFYEKTKHKIYILIDEYDNFANAILSAYSHEEYMQLTHGGGFFKDFFKKLKAATEESESSLAKLFITGVSPITLDDVTSGFNIGENLSLDPRLSTFFGFTEKEIATIYEYYTSLNLLNIDKDEFFKIISAWYNGYSFNEDTTDRVYNPDMIFYFLKHIMVLKKLPRDLIDENVRIDYAKMRHLITVDRKVKTFNGNFSILKQIIENGIAGGRVVKTFPLERLTHPQNFTSHLFYLGLLSFNGDDELIIPNETVNQLLYEHLRDAYEDTGIFRSNLYFLAEKIKNMAYSGEWKGVFEQLSNEINTQTSIRDYLQGEQTIKAFLAAYISITDYFIVHLERELNKGFADLYLKPFYEKNQKVRFGYLIEIKYIPRGEKLTENILNKKRAEAKAQLLKYAEDDIISRKSPKELKLIYQIWHGWELVEMEEI
ncbi:ATP-binding protein [Desulfothermus naphthae]